MIFFRWNILERVVNTIRDQALKILFKTFPDNDPTSIYECVDEWSAKQVTTAGLVKYYEAYYNNTQ